MKARWWKFVLGGVVALVVSLWTIDSISTQYKENGYSRKSVRDAQQILQACEAYRDHLQNPERGKYPSVLSDLVRPPFGEPSFLRNGEAALYDPWGNQFEYTVVGNGTTEVEVRIWTVGRVDGKRKEVGVKRRANGTAEQFGLD